jgi:hypothetical protein
MLIMIRKLILRRWRITFIFSKLLNSIIVNCSAISCASYSRGFDLKFGSAEVADLGYRRYLKLNLLLN